MKGFISKGGVLHIKRGNNLVSQECPHRDHKVCSDCCPLFGEIRDGGEVKMLELCQAILYFEELIDQREQEEDKEPDHVSFDG